MRIFCQRDILVCIVCCFLITVDILVQFAFDTGSFLITKPRAGPFVALYLVQSSVDTCVQLGNLGGQAGVGSLVGIPLCLIGIQT